MTDNSKTGKKINYNISTSLETRPHTHQGAFKFQYQMQDQDSSVVYLDHPNSELHHGLKKKKLKKKAIKKDKESKKMGISCDIKITHITKRRSKTKGKNTVRPNSPKPKLKKADSQTSKDRNKNPSHVNPPHKEPKKELKKCQSHPTIPFPESSPAPIRKKIEQQKPIQIEYLYNPLSGHFQQATTELLLDLQSQLKANHKPSHQQDQDGIDEQLLGYLVQNVNRIKKAWKSSRMRRNVMDGINRRILEKRKKTVEMDQENLSLEKEKAVENVQEGRKNIDDEDLALSMSIPSEYCNSDIQLSQHHQPAYHHHYQDLQPVLPPTPHNIPHSQHAQIIDSKLDQLKQALAQIEPKHEQEKSISGEWRTAITLIQQLSGEKNPAEKLVIAEQIEHLCKKKKEDYSGSVGGGILEEKEKEKDAEAIISVRQNAMEMLFTAHQKILKNLLSSGKLTLIDFNRKMTGLKKWVEQEKQEVTRIRDLLNSNFVKAQDMLQRTKRDLKLAQQAGSSKELLESLMSSIGCQEDGFDIPKSVSSDSQELDDSSSMILMLMQREMRKRQIKETIDRRIYSQLTQPKNFTGQGKAIITSLYLINIYLSNLSNFLYSYYKDMFLNQLNNPYGYPPEDRLRIIHGYTQSLPDMPDDDGLRNTIPLEIYHEMNQQIYSDQQDSNEYEIAHNRALFDAFNLAIRYFRPYYMIGGSPYHWTIGDRALTFFFIEEHNLEEVFEKSKLKVMQWASSLCALHYPDTAPCAPKEFKATGMDELLAYTSNQNGMLSKTREDRMKKVQKEQLNEEDISWYFHEQDRTGFILQISEQIFIELCQELTESLIINNRTFL